MSKLRRLLAFIGIVGLFCAIALLPTFRTYAAVKIDSYPEDKAKAFFYGSWLVNCFSNGSYSIDMSGDASVNGMNVGPGDSFATGLTGIDPKKCNDKVYATDAIRFLGIPWSVPQDALNFLCDIGATRSGTCTDLNNSQRISLRANDSTGRKVRDIINRNAGYDVFSAYSSSKLLQYTYNINLAFLKQCEAKDNNTSQGLADDITDVKVLKGDGTYTTERRQYNPNALISFDDDLNGHWATIRNKNDQPQVNCQTIVNRVNTLAGDPTVAQEWINNYTPGHGNIPGTCEDRYGASASELKACQDGFNNKADANFCSTTYPYSSGMPEALRAANAACNWGRDKATGASGKTTPQDPTGSAGNSSGGDAPTSLCGFDGDSMEWLICPVTTALQKFSTSLASNIEGLMYFPTQDVFGITGNEEKTKNLQNAWASFRNIAIAIIIIAGLAMVISQALGFEFLDAYTMRKLLPRMGVALVGIALSWNIMQFAIELTNDLGSFTHDVLVGPFSKMEVAGVDSSNGVYNWATLVGLIVAGVPKLFFLGGVGVATILLIIGLIVLLAFMIFGLRWVVILMCILTAPFAIAAYVLPGTQKIWAFWKNTIVMSLALFPVIMGLLAAGEVMARVSSQMKVAGGYILVVIMYFGPVLLIIPIAQKFGGVLGGAIGWASGLGNKMAGRGNKFLHDSAEWRKGEYATGAKQGPGLVNAYARRSALARQGGFSVSRKGRAQYRQAEKKLIQDAAAERAEKDKGFSLGATDATIPAIYANSRDDYIRQYIDRNREGMAREGLSEHQMRQRARTRMAQLEAGTGTTMGTRAMKAAAFRGQTMDGAGWFKDIKDEKGNVIGGETNFQAIAEASNHLIKQGVMSDEDIGGILGQNQARADFSGLTFSQRVGIASMGERGNGRLSNSEENLLKSQSYQSMRNSQAELGNLRTARRISEEGGKRLNATLTGDRADFVGGDGKSLLTGQTDMDMLASEFATFANFQDMASSASIDAREQFAAQLKQEYRADQLTPEMQRILAPVLSENNNVVTTQQIMEFCRSNANNELTNLFTARRREYGSARANAGAAQGGRVEAPAITPPS